MPVSAAVRANPIYLEAAPMMVAESWTSSIGESWLSLLLNIWELRDIEPLRKISIEVVQLILDELACQGGEVPNRISAAPVAAFEGIGICLAERPNENPIRLL